MAGGARGRLRGGRVAGVPRVRRCRRSQIHGGGKLGGGGSIAKVQGGDGMELGARGEDQILVRGRRIGRAGLRIDSQGNVYVPDSEEEEEADMEMDHAVAEGAAAVATDVVGPAVVAAADGAPTMEVASEGDPGMELSPEVQARLDAVLAGIDPLYHDVFISFYKVMVPAFFKSN